MKIARRDTSSLQHSNPKAMLIVFAVAGVASALTGFVMRGLVEVGHNATTAPGSCQVVDHALEAEADRTFNLPVVRIDAWSDDDPS